MEVQRFETYEELCERIGDEIAAELRENPKMTLSIAAGHSSLGVLKVLREYYEAGKVDFSHANFVELDEWLGMSEETPNSCGAFLKAELLDVVPFGKVRLFDGTLEDVESECRAVEEFIEKESKEGRIDYLILGCGMNGHLGLNEPGTPFDSRTRVTELDSVTLEVGQKYFKEQTKLEGGITLGMLNFQQAKRTVLIFSGAHKREALIKTLQEPVSVKWPASAIRTYENAAVFYDADAGEADLETK